MNRQMLNEATRLQARIMRWASDVLTQEKTTAEVGAEARAWVGTDGQRLWALACASLGCAKDLMVDTVTKRTGRLSTAEEGSWLPALMGGKVSNEPSAVAATQTIIAMLNRDADMAMDIMIAHVRVAGAAGLYDMAMVGIAIVHAMLDPALHGVEAVKRTE